MSERAEALHITCSPAIQFTFISNTDRYSIVFSEFNIAEHFALTSFLFFDAILKFSFNLNAFKMYKLIRSCVQDVIECLLNDSAQKVEG